MDGWVRWISPSSSSKGISGSYSRQETGRKEWGILQESSQKDKTREGNKEEITEEERRMSSGSRIFERIFLKWKRGRMWNFCLCFIVSLLFENSETKTRTGRRKTKRSQEDKEAVNRIQISGGKFPKFFSHLLCFSSCQWIVLTFTSREILIPSSSWVFVTNLFQDSQRDKC